MTAIRLAFGALVGIYHATSRVAVGSAQGRVSRDDMTALIANLVHDVLLGVWLMGATGHSVELGWIMAALFSLREFDTDHV